MYLGDVEQEMFMQLEVDREESKVLGTCLTRDANVVGS